MDKTRGHAAAIITIFVWGVTFISTKILLTGFLPVEILFCRFVIGYLALFAICPRLLPYGACGRSLFCCSGAYRHLPLLFAGKHCPYLYAGFQCRCAALHGSVFYGAGRFCSFAR